MIARSRSPSRFGLTVASRRRSPANLRPTVPDLQVQQLGCIWGHLRHGHQLNLRKRLSVRRPLAQLFILM